MRKDLETGNPIRNSALQQHTHPLPTVYSRSDQFIRQMGRDKIQEHPHLPSFFTRTLLEQIFCCVMMSINGNTTSTWKINGGTDIGWTLLFHPKNISELGKIEQERYGTYIFQKITAKHHYKKKKRLELISQFLVGGVFLCFGLFSFFLSFFN